MYGSYSSEAQKVWDFVRCQRPNGTFYGSPSGRCKKGKEVGAKEEKAPKSKKAKKEVASTGSGRVTDEDIERASIEYDRVTNEWGGLIWEKKKEEAKALEPKKQEAWDRLQELKKRKAEQDAKDAPEKKSGKTKVNAKNFDSEKAQAEAEKRQQAYNAAQSKVKLNDKQADALYIYSSDDKEVPGKFAYQQLNKCARDPSNCSNPKKARELSKNLDSALAALPKNEGGDPFFRGIDTRDSPAAARLFESLSAAKPGDVISDPAFGSYSSNPAVARDFATSGSKSIVFVSRNKQLTPMNTYAIIPEQNEALLPRGTEQTIRKVTRNGDTLIVEVD